MVIWTNPKCEKCYLLIEAKQFEEGYKSLKTYESGEYLNTVGSQAKGYIDANPEYYNDKVVFIVPICFGWIRKPRILEEAIKNFVEVLPGNTSIHFCSLYYKGKHGARVYGNVYPPSKYNVDV
jgi:hypothetical protein